MKYLSVVKQHLNDKGREQKMNLKVLKISETEEKLKKRIDLFIQNENTNGEFVNSLKYLSYHPQERFIDDSIIVVDDKNKEIKGVMMAASIPGNCQHIISHPGTTFSGPVISTKIDIKVAEEILDLMLAYYEKKYEYVEIRLRPLIYDVQPMEWIQYFMLRKGYHYDMTALANVINLTKMRDDDHVLASFSSGRRYYVKQAIKSKKYEIKKIDVPNKSMWENLNNTLKLKFDSKTTHSFEEILLLCRMFPEQIVTYVAERYDGTYGASAVLYCYKNVLHTQYLDLNYQYASEYPNLQLIYEIIKKAVKDEYSFFSFGASTEKRGEILNEGLYQYKNGYGGGAIVLPVMIWNKR